MWNSLMMQSSPLCSNLATRSCRVSLAVTVTIGNLRFLRIMSEHQLIAILQPKIECNQVNYSRGRVSPSLVDWREKSPASNPCLSIDRIGGTIRG